MYLVVKTKTGKRWWRSTKAIIHSKRSSPRLELKNVRKDYLPSKQIFDEMSRIDKLCKKNRYDNHCLRYEGNLVINNDEEYTENIYLLAKQTLEFKRLVKSRYDHEQDIMSYIDAQIKKHGIVGALLKLKKMIPS